MKKAIMLALAALLAAVCLSACGQKAALPAEADGKLRIVTTIFPEYDWVMQVLGDRAEQAEVTLLLDKGVDLHSFQPSVGDLAKLSSCDLFLYVGGESDKWVSDALQGAANKNMVVINLLETLGAAAKEEELVEGMQGEAAEADEDEAETGPEYDEHVWLSLRNAAVFVRRIAQALTELDSDGAADYQRSAAAYLEKLDALDRAYADAVSGASRRTLLFGDRFPFRYLTDDYGLDYYAAFVGCSAETEASFETITFLAQKTDALSLPAVLTIEGADHRIAETIIQNTQSGNQKILTLDSMQATTAKDIQSGASYLSIMEGNLAVLKEALQ